MKKLYTFILVYIICFANAQTCSPFPQTMFFQDFESPTSSTLPETVNSGTMGYYTTAGYFIGARSRSINNSTIDVDYGSVNASFATNVKISFSFAPINIDDNPNDYLQFFIYSGSWSNEIAIWNNTGSNNLTYNLSTELKNTFTYDGDNNPSDIYMSSSNKVNKVEISIPNTVDRSNLKIGFLAKNNRNDEYWIIDDIKITGNFIDTKTWNGTSWTGRNTNAPTITEIAVINGNYNTGTNGNINACKCTVNSTRTLTIAANSNVTLQHDLINNGTINVENNGNLVQLENSGTFSGNNITVKRDANMKRLHYNYWSSPVNAQNLKSFSPNTLNNRFYTYNESTDFFNTIDPVANSFTNAKGYAIRAPNNFSNTSATTFNGNFIGAPNNGTITTTITKSGNGFNLVGNPYPSNISFSDFYSANSTIINPKVYFWTNSDPNPPANQQGAAYSGNNYATRNLTGGTPAMGSTVVPTDIIVVGQGFIVEKTNAGSSNITFNNSMRKTSTGNFFNARMSSKAESPKYWLRLTTPVKNFNTILIGYVNGATNNLDLGYDTEPIVESSDSFYSVIENKNLIIQGRESNFTTTDIIPLGGNFFEAGNYEISVANKEGIFNGSQDIYLKDKSLNITVKITDSPYQFYSEAGTFNNRFEIVYKPESTLGTDEINKNQETKIYENGAEIIVENKIQKITEVQVFDASGKLLATLKPNDNKVTFSKASFQKGLLVFNIKTKEKITSKKFLVK